MGTPRGRTSLVTPLLPSLPTLGNRSRRLPEINPKLPLRSQIQDMEDVAEIDYAYQHFRRDQISRLLDRLTWNRLDSNMHQFTRFPHDWNTDPNAIHSELIA